MFAGRISRLRTDVPSLRATPLFMRHAPHAGDLAAALALRRYCRAHGPFAVVHSHSTKAGLLGRVGLLGYPAVRVYTPHAPLTLNPSLGAAQRVAARGYERVLAAVTDGVILVSPEELEHVQSLGISPRKLFLVPNGISVIPAPQRTRARRAVRKALGLAGDSVCVGFVGRLAPQKNLKVLLDAFARLVADIPKSTRVAIVGGGPMEARLRAQSDWLGLNGSVLWLGEREGTEVMPAFDIFALSSDYEGLPYVLLEAMAAELPIVTTRVGGVRLLAESGGIASVVPPGRSDLFAEALRPLILDRGLRLRMGRNARRKVEQFTVREMVRGTTNVYERLLSERSPTFSYATAPQGG